MLKSYKKLNRQSGRLTYVEFDPYFGELEVSEPSPAQPPRSEEIMRHDYSGELLNSSPDDPGNPRRAHAPPCCRSAKLAGER